MESAQHRRLRCIVKMGGAAITHKEELESINVKMLSITCRQLRQAMSLSSSASVNMDWSRGDEGPHAAEFFDLQGKDIDTEHFIIIHGAGSFGHFQASKSNVHKGGLETTMGKAGFVATRISVTKLNQEIVRALACEGIPAVGISPFCAGWSTTNRAVSILPWCCQPYNKGGDEATSTDRCKIFKRKSRKIAAGVVQFMLDMPGFMTLL